MYQEQATTGKPYDHVIEDDIRLDAYMTCRAEEAQQATSDRRERAETFKAREKLQGTGVSAKGTVSHHKVRQR